MTMMVVAALAGAGCGRSGPGGAAAAPAARAEVPAADPGVADASEEAASVNGQIIYRADVELEARMKGLVREGDKLDPGGKVYNDILDQLIDIKLLAMEAVGRGLDEEPDARHRLEVARDNILGNILMERIAAERIDEASIRKMYDAQAALLTEQMETEVHLRHILAPTREAIEQAAAELRNGADFVIVAGRRSTDAATRLDGGDLGYRTEKDASPEFARVIRELPAGGLSRPFQDKDGWHIVKVEDVRKRRPPSLEELRGRIERYLRTQQLEDVLKQLRADGQIIRNKALRGPGRSQKPAAEPPAPAFQASAPPGAAIETRDAPPPAAQPAPPAGATRPNR